MKPFVPLLVFYIVVGFLTFGFAYTREWSPLQAQTGGQQIGSILSGFFWPLYWPGYLSIKLFES